jgi:SAM-dependent methyltransferase
VASAASQPLFRRVERCWVCDGADLSPFHQCRFDYQEYAKQDPALHRYTGQTAWLVRCGACGFGQPDRLPVLPGFFDRMYDQRWSDAWIASEFESETKDLIFRTILGELDRRCPERPRRLLDVGAHAGRFLHVAQRAGWQVEGIELNPRTAAFAAHRTGARVHQINARALAASGERFHAVTLTDVLEHIPEPVQLLVTLAQLVEAGGTIAVKVPCGRSQWHKERMLSAISASREISLAGNLVHVNHFTPRSLAAALERAGFRAVGVQTGAPELPPPPSGATAVTSSPLRRVASNALRRAVYAAARLPGAVHTPLALNLQAYASR